MKKSKDRRISDEIERLEGLFVDLDENTRSSIDGLIKRAAYMRIQLEEMEIDLLENGYTEKFTQSTNTAPYDRERPVAKIYNTLNKNYQTIMKQLITELPVSAPADLSEEIMRFASGAK